MLKMARFDHIDGHCALNNQRYVNIAGRLPENSRNRFVDRQSKKHSKKQTKKIVFSLKADLLYFD